MGSTCFTLLPLFRTKRFPEVLANFLIGVRLNLPTKRWLDIELKVQMNY
jgi:hypothetical protein